MNEINEKNNNERFVAKKGEYVFKNNSTSNNFAEEIQKRRMDEMANAMKKYMPIGSVVKIAESFKNYMIIGFDCKIAEKIYDYLACEYPFGIDSNHRSCGFNHEQIEKVFYIGFVNNQEKIFKAGISKKHDGEETDR